MRTCTVKLYRTVHRYRYLKLVFPEALPILLMSKYVAFEYMRECMRIEFCMRVCDARVDIFVSRVDALWLLRCHAVRVYYRWKRGGTFEMSVTFRNMNWPNAQQIFFKDCCRKHHNQRF